MANVNFPVQQSQKVQTIYQGLQAAADEGNFYVATNATTGTAIATTTSVVDDAATASSTHAQASPVMVVVNGWSATDPNAKNIYLQYLRMKIVQVPTSATQWNMSIRADNNAGAITSAGTAITPVNVNTGSGNLSRATVQFGAITTALPNTSGRLLANAVIDPTIPVTLDQWYITFGSLGMSMDQLSGGTNAKNITLCLAPIIIAPGWNIRIGMWGASNAAAPSWEFELGYVERASGL